MLADGIYILREFNFCKKIIGVSNVELKISPKKLKHGIRDGNIHHQTIQLLQKRYITVQNIHIRTIQLLPKTSQELRMLSSVTLYCQVKKIVMNSYSQLSEM